jgi:hypothetical protein
MLIDKTIEVLSKYNYIKEEQSFKKITLEKDKHKMDQLCTETLIKNTKVADNDHQSFIKNVSCLICLRKKRRSIKTDLKKAEIISKMKNIDLIPPFQNLKYTSKLNVCIELKDILKSINDVFQIIEVKEANTIINDNQITTSNLFPIKNIAEKTKKEAVSSVIILNDVNNETNRAQKNIANLNRNTFTPKITSPETELKPIKLKTNLKSLPYIKELLK